MGGSIGEGESFAEIFRTALARQGMTLSALQRELDRRGIQLSLGALSYWRSASRQPDATRQRDTILEAEEILGLPHNALLRAAIDAHSAMDLPAPAPQLELLEFDGGALHEEARQRFDAVPSEGARDVSLRQVTDVGANGGSQRCVIQAVVQCVADSMRRHTWSLFSEYGTAGNYSLTVAGDASAGERWVDPLGRISAVAVEFEPPLEKGDTRMVEVRVDYRGGADAERSTGIAVTRSVQKVINWVRFHPDAVPDWFIETEVTDGQVSRSFRGLDTPTSIHQARWKFGPGTISVEWGYGEAPALA